MNREAIPARAKTPTITRKPEAGAHSLAPLGAWIAVRGSFEGDLRPILLLAAAVWSWVAGFDLIYACQDAEFDRKSGLHSVPARFGVGRALTAARVSHLVTIACLVAFTASADLSWIYWTAVGGAAILLAWEHSSTSFPCSSSA